MSISFPIIMIKIFKEPGKAELDLFIFKEASIPYRKCQRSFA